MGLRAGLDCCGKSRPTGIRSPDRPARRQSLYRLGYGAHEVYIYIYTGLFISPSGISDPCCTVVGIVTPKGSMSTEGETLQVSVLHLQFPASAIC